MYTIGIAYCDNKNTEVIPQTKNLVKGLFQTKVHITNIKYQENGQCLSSLLYGLDLTCIEHHGPCFPDECICWVVFLHGNNENDLPS